MGQFNSKCFTGKADPTNTKPVEQAETYGGVAQAGVAQGVPCYEVAGCDGSQFPFASLSWSDFAIGRVMDG